MADATIRGRFVWHELMTTDSKAAADFYARVIGWKVKPWEQNPSYLMMSMGSAPMAGVFPRPDEASETPPLWYTYMATPDVDATSRQAEALGGKVMRAPSDIPTIGRFSIIRDPQGALFCAFTPLPTQQPRNLDAQRGIGDFSWHELATTDGDAAFAFYEHLFGWKEAGSMDMGPGMGKYLMFGFGDGPVGGIFTRSGQMPAPIGWLPYIRVADAKKTAAAITKASAKVINGPMEVPGGDWITQALDLQGALFAVHSLNPAGPASAEPAGRESKPAPARKSARKAAKKTAATKTASRKTTARAGAAKKSAARKAVASKGAAKGAAKKGGARKTAAEPRFLGKLVKKVKKTAGARKGAAKRGRRR